MNMNADHVIFIYFTATFLLGVGFSWYAWMHSAHPRRRRRHA